jgi:CrcB protein
MSEDRDDALADGLHIPVSRRRLGGRADPSILLVILVGGGLGTLGRYGVSRAIHVTKDTFPWATLTTNLVGAFALGLFLTLLLERFPPTRFARPFVAIGFLGGFTTFSTMAVETVLLCKDGAPAIGIGYLLASVFFGLVACYLGIVLARLSPFGANTAPR